MTERWRCFVAVPIGERLRDELIAATSVWQSPDLRWTDPHGWHVTLAFLGDVEAERVAAIAARLPALVTVPDPIDLVPEGLVAWPRPEEARMLWCRFRPDPALTDLHNAVAGGLGVTERRRFRPHITLARVRGGGVTSLSPAGRQPGGSLATSPVDEVVLVRSHLVASGSRYEALATVSLAGVRV